MLMAKNNRTLMCRIKNFSHMGRKKPNLILRKAIIIAVENQLNSNNPPEVRKTLNRLMARNKDIDFDSAVEIIAAVLIGEIYDMFKNQEEFNEKRYAKELKKL